LVAVRKDAAAKGNTRLEFFAVYVMFGLSSAMKHRPTIRQVIGKILAVELALAGGTLSAASYLDTNGFPTLWATTTNLNGSGVVVMQAEAELSTNPPTWEVDPAATGLPASLFTYYSTNGPVTGFPNSLGADSGHADAVASYFYGLPSGEATNVAAVYNYEADYFAASFIQALNPPNINSPVVNQSFTFGALSVSDQRSLDSDYDNYAAEYSTLFVSAVDNGGNVHAPGTSYNGLGVGDYGGSSSIGPTVDNGRCKPDITAPASETSYATPQIAGAVTVLLQAALRGDGGGATNSAADFRTLKALLLNGAVKPAGWTNSPASPLDARYGAGLVNIFNSYTQLAGGQHGYIDSSSVSLGGAHPPTGASGTVNASSGWDFNTITSSINTDAVNHYYFNATNPLFIATLVWNRQRDESSINNLFLFLYNAANSNLVGACTSAVDNVQHLFMPNLPAGRYDLQVLKTGGDMLLDTNMVSDSETYALAFEFSGPALSLAHSGSNVVLAWPLYPAGLWLAATTSLNPPVTWTAVNPSPPIVNGQYQVVVPITSGNQFFQLRQP
jgi:hypothetical protein